MEFKKSRISIQKKYREMPSLKRLQDTLGTNQHNTFIFMKLSLKLLLAFILFFEKHRELLLLGTKSYVTPGINQHNTS